MGIPKFFRFISERWPTISQLIDGTQIPEFDNFYLDMNSILHTCTRPKDEDVNKRLTEEEVFTAIFAYIDHLFDTIKPKKVFYMAIDGVAPRAKMNQQRSRRFRTAIDAEKNLKKAIEQGEELPKDEPFDSNSITPGTEFMAKLTKFLKYFIHKKVSTDSRWQDVEIILSGHEVPGEGEHKIMQFIRTKRSLENYDPNTRHCIYGLDADLIMLGLVSHDPHFALLREEVTFGKRSQVQKSLEEQKFFLLHLSLVREYLELEFNDLKTDLSFEYNFERILDDFVLIMYVIGNDFLPNLPDLHLNKGAFPLLLETFKQSLKSIDGYINENGKINLQRLGKWLEYLSKFELENFEQGEIDLEWFNKQLENISISGAKKRERIGKLALLKQQRKLVGFIKPWLIKIYSKRLSNVTDIDEIPTLELPKELVENNLDFLKSFAYDSDLNIVHSQQKNLFFVKIDIDGIDLNESDEDFEERSNTIRRIIKRYEAAIILDSEGENSIEEKKLIYNEKFENWKDQYYQDKLGFSINDENEMQEITENYVEGLQWVLYYYYQGVPSWPWYYRYHYAPRISDIKRALNVSINFEKGQPFKPFEQLMAVLPARSSKLVPIPYRALMKEENSPIVDFYPNDVEFDMNGKTAEWEAVVKISFVDQKRLQDALLPLDPLLTQEEKIRNSFGKDHLFTFNPQIEEVFKSPLPGVFSDLESNHCFESIYSLEHVDPSNYHNGLVKGVLLGESALAGFPTLKSIPFDDELKNAGLYIFNQPSRSQSRILTPKDIHEGLSVDQFAERYVGKIVYTRYPYLRESKIIRVSDGKTDFKSEKTDKGFKTYSRETSYEDGKTYKATVENFKRQYATSKGIELKQIRALVYVQPVSGLKRNNAGAYVKEYAKEEEIYPLELVVENVTNKDERYVERPPLPINEEFPIGSKVIFLGEYAYGGQATIDNYRTTTRLKISVEKTSTKTEPTIGSTLAHREYNENIYYPSYEVTRSLGIHPLFLSKITSSFMIEGHKGQKTNIGLDLKFDGKREKVIGYTKKSEKGWQYSAHAIGLIKDYRRLFPEFFNTVANKSSAPGQFVKLKDIWPNADIKEAEERIKKITDWLKVTRSTLMRASLESDSLSRFSIKEIEDQIEIFAGLPDKKETKKLDGVPRDAILDPKVSFSKLSRQAFHLGDRVVYIHDTGKVPLFSRGTVVAYHSIGSNVTLQVLFDKPIMGGNKLDGRLRTNRGLNVDSSLVLNLSNKQFIYHSNASSNRKSKSQAANGRPNIKPRPQKTVSDVKTSKPLKETNANGKIETAEKSSSEKPIAKKEILKKESARTGLLSLLKGEKSKESEINNEDESSNPVRAIASKHIQNSILQGIHGQQLPQQTFQTHGPFPPFSAFPQQIGFIPPEFVHPGLVAPEFPIAAPSQTSQQQFTPRSDNAKPHSKGKPKNHGRKSYSNRGKKLDKSSEAGQKHVKHNRNPVE
ncbi:hypothetical protein WICMUC_004839 [Wickerhamomyces mucosus]|uniref:5'-3' exoribonuclease 1 n=1 Tax=Wickerhamomyces mucosus TaxID=1378264 RepID=A0A9P8PDN6_9ASCO|nr:hypothetical protein WICMUC_004839 [Wickerhamomyces mucosus]